MGLRLRLREVCHATGLSMAQLSDMERGVGTTPLRPVERLCEVLRIAPAELVAAIVQDQLREAGLLFEVRIEAGSVVIRLPLMNV
jgi:transcriptional regulator with XRE-family HTH domain